MDEPTNDEDADTDWGKIIEGVRGSAAARVWYEFKNCQPLKSEAEDDCRQETSANVDRPDEQSLAAAQDLTAGSNGQP